MPTPGKPSNVIRLEGKSHRSEAELQLREEGEQSLLTGERMEAWPSLDAQAKKEFARVKGLFAIIGKDDALYEGSVNRYCELKAECDKYKKSIKRANGKLITLARKYKEKEIEFLEYITIEQKIIGNINAADRQLQSKRTMMLNLEKENCMTIAAALRAIPKKVEKKKKNPMEKAGFVV